jgi:cell division protein FtsI/penicillin-binding protein 2
MKLSPLRPTAVFFCIALFLLTLSATTTSVAQAKKTSAKDAKAASSAKDTRKAVADRKGKDDKRSRQIGADKKTTDKKAADKRSADKNSKTAKKNDPKKPESKKDDKRTAGRKDDDKKPVNKKEEARRTAAERRRLEEERRQAALEERRRREQAIREARERKLAFERGLRTETAANISRDNTEGEDLQVRQAAVAALGDRAGSVVVMEAQTGKILTIVNQEWAARQPIKPCSTIKLVTGVAGLNEGVIDVNDGRTKEIPNRLGLDDSLAFSDNPYFQKVGSAVGNPKVIEYARQLGLGQQTGINLENESPGRLPYGNHNPRIYSHGDDFEVTGLQLAVMVSAITNGGKIVTPRIPRTSIERANFETQSKGFISIPSQNLRRVIPGMMGASEYGTARRNMDQTLGVAGKTGSCIGRNSWVGLFASVAPIEEPKYAVVVITRGESERGRNAAAVAAQIYRYLSPNIQRTNRNLAQTEFRLQPRNRMDVQTAARAVSEGEEAESVREGDARRPVIIVPSVRRTAESAPQKLVTKTGDSAPVFPPVVITYDKEGADRKDGPKPRP